MALEPIKRREFREADRADVQESLIRDVEADPEQFFRAYLGFEQSYRGRYVSADLFKETFRAYNQSRETRNRHNAPVHNAAAVLASEQLRRVLGQPIEPGRDQVVLLTGIPGAGKTFAVLDNGDLPRRAHAVYEGQLADPNVAVAKVQEVLDAGLKPVIVAVHAQPERALENTLQRFADRGRGAGIDIMARIQSGLPEGLAAVRDRFGETVELRVLDRRDFAEPKKLKGWDSLSVLKSEGDYEQIKERLTQHLERQRESLSEAAWRQATGLAPTVPDRRIDRGLGREHEAAVSERGAPQEGGQEGVLSSRQPAAPESTLERLRNRSDKVVERVTAELRRESAAQEEADRERAAEQQRQLEAGRERSRSQSRDRGDGFEFES